MDKYRGFRSDIKGHGRGINPGAFVIDRCVGIAYLASEYHFGLRNQMATVKATSRVRSLLFALISLGGILAGCMGDSSLGPIDKKVTPTYLGDNVDTTFARHYGMGDTLAVDSGFLISFGETPFDSVLSAHKQFLTVNTVQLYYVYNQYLIADVTVAAGKISVDITGVQLPGNLFQPALKQSEVTEYLEMNQPCMILK
jgi:hypothetical protein